MKSFVGLILLFFSVVCFAQRMYVQDESINVYKYKDSSQQKCFERMDESFIKDKEKSGLVRKVKKRTEKKQEIVRRFEAIPSGYYAGLINASFTGDELKFFFFKSYVFKEYEGRLTREYEEVKYRWTAGTQLLVHGVTVGTMLMFKDTRDGTFGCRGKRFTSTFFDNEYTATENFKVMADLSPLSKYDEAPKPMKIEAFRLKVGTSVIDLQPSKILRNTKSFKSYALENYVIDLNKIFTEEQILKLDGKAITIECIGSCAPVNVPSDVQWKLPGDMISELKTSEKFNFDLKLYANVKYEMTVPEFERKVALDKIEKERVAEVKRKAKIEEEKRLARQRKLDEERYARIKKENEEAQRRAKIAEEKRLARQRKLEEERIAREKREKAEAIRLAKIEEKRRLEREKKLEEERIAREARQKVEAIRQAKIEEEKRLKEADRALWASLKPVGVGSSFSVSSEGYLITNYHVVDGCQGVVVHNKGESKKARIVSSDRNNDLALLKADFKPMASYTFNTSNPRLLQEVIVAGFPLVSRLKSANIRVTKGIVSALSGPEDNYSQIQIDAAVQPGNSGGPIVDKNGQVIGVVSFGLNKLLTFKKDGTIPENVNFGIKSNVVSNFLESNQIKVLKKIPKNTGNDYLESTLQNATHLITCWMTTARFDEFKTKRQLYDNLIR